MKLSDFQLVMFDLDGTLVDSALDLHIALNLSLEEAGYPLVSLDDCRLWVGNGAEVLVNRALQQTLDVSGFHFDLPRVLELFYKHYSEINGQHSELYEGALTLLAQLKEAGCFVAIVTNKPEAPARVLIDQKGLVVDMLVGGDTTQERKPNPLPLQHCMAHFGVSEDASVLVGDSINDFQAARRAGVKVVGVSYGYNHGLPIDARNLDAFVDSLSELS